MPPAPVCRSEGADFLAGVLRAGMMARCFDLLTQPCCGWRCVHRTKLFAVQALHQERAVKTVPAGAVLHQSHGRLTYHWSLRVAITPPLTIGAN